jgi:hypothetical protein
MSAGTGETSTQTCSRCGTTFPGWSLFCTSCGQQGADSVARPGAGQVAPVYGQPTGRAVRTTSSTHGTWAIVWTVCGWVLCLLFWFPAFSQAKKSRQRGEAIASTATNVVQIGFFIWLVVQVAGIAFYLWIYDRTGQLPGELPTTVPPPSTIPPLGS